MGYLYNYHSLSCTYTFNVYILLEIKGTLLCSVASEDLAIDISSVEVVPFLLVLSLSQEQAKMVLLVLLEIHS